MLGLRMDRTQGSSGRLSSLDTLFRALLQGTSARTTFHPCVSPLETQTLEGGADWARLGLGPNPMVRDVVVVTGHLPEATWGQGS